MKKQKRNKFLIAILVTMFALGLFFQSNPTLLAQNKSEAISVISTAGSVIKDHPDYLQKSIKIIKENNVADGDIVAWINETPLIKSELEFRKNLTLKSGGSQDLNSIFNKLIEEKIIFEIAKSKNLLPSEQDLNEYIQEQIQDYNNPELNYKELVDTFRNASGLTLDQYWNEYTWYNGYRFLVLLNVYNSAIKDGQQTGKITKITETKDLTPEINKEYHQYWDKLKTEYKNTLKVTLSEKYKGLGLSIK